MFYTMYTTKEKLANMESGTGSYASYAKDSVIPRSTFYKCAHAYKYCDNTTDSKPAMGLVNLGRPVPFATEEYKFVVNYTARESR